MFEYRTLLALIPGLPLLAAIITAALGPRLLKERSHWPVAIAFVCSFIASVMLLVKVNEDAHHAVEGGEAAATIGFEHTVDYWTWAAIDDAYKTTHRTPYGPLDAPEEIAPSVANLNIGVTLRADPLTAIMLAMVTFVSTLVVIYASGYMHGDRGYWRFFTYVSLFVFSMTMLVSSSNFVMLYVFWEAVGMCSYLLIGFWYEKPEAAAAGKKAFLVNRVGDFGFALGIFLIWSTYGTLNFHDTTLADGTVVAGVLGQTRLASGLFVTGGVATAICLCLMTGACGKSAQFPLHVWLPDAMEGPTPVSALIHAATMVTAGVYMVARCTPLFMASPDAQTVVACIGGFTALLAALIALTQNDLKRVLAYSTVSQLGYMFLGLGTGVLSGVVAGMFHLFTHAFFKALLFLGAGSVMHAMGNVIDMRRFGGLRKIMPWTSGTFWFGCLALAGIVPFAGFWSKDAIIAAVHGVAHHQHSTLYQVLYFSAVFTAFLTAFYTFRALFMTFYGPEVIPHEAGHHAHESPRSMTIPLAVLAFCSLVVGAYFELTHSFAHFLLLTPSLAYEGAQATLKEPIGTFHMDVAMVSTLVAVAGLGLAAFLYLGHRREVDYLGRISEGLDRMTGPARTFVAKPVRAAYLLSSRKFFIDELYTVFIVWPLRLLAEISYLLDRWLVDGLVNFVGWIPQALGSSVRSLQSGLVQFYALAMVLGALVLMGTLIWWPAG